jgi:transcriptional regulator with XRE-family HTH domain
MTALTSTAYSRDLGDELRRLREQHSGLTGAAFADRLGWDASKVSNIEKGKARASEIDLVQYVLLCGKDTEFFEQFRARYRYAFDLNVVQVHDNVRTVAMVEALAQKIVSYNVLTIPGLVQTSKYARALFTECGMSPEKTEVNHRARMERQAILQRQNRPECLFYVHELALQLRLADDRAMEDQYLRLLFNTHQLRMVPMTAGPAAVTRSARTLFEFEKASPVVYTESDVAQVFAQEHRVVSDSTAFFRWLDERALDEHESRTLLGRYLSHV